MVKMHFSYNSARRSFILREMRCRQTILRLWNQIRLGYSPIRLNTACSVHLNGRPVESDWTAHNSLKWPILLSTRAALSICLFLLTGLVCFAKDIYIAQTAQGSDTGADAADSHSIVWFNTAGNWGSGANKISAGDTVHLTGILTSAITIQGSGSAGSPITVFMEPGAKFSAATWTANVITLSRVNYVIIDGGTNGIIEATNNGVGKTYQNDIIAVYVNACQNCEVRNLTIQNLYIRTQNSSDTMGGSVGISVGYGGPPNNTLIHNNTITWAGVGIGITFTSGGPLSVYSNIIRYTSSGITFGSSNSSATFSGIAIYNNDISDGYVWDHPSNLFHHEAVHFWGYGPNVTGLAVYGNYVHGNWGVNFTSELFFEGQASNYEVYNNVLISPIRHIYTKLAGPGVIYNNTIANAGAEMDSVTGSVADFANNICYETDGMFFNGNRGTNPDVTSENNLTVNPLFVNAAGNQYHLSTGSPAIGAGLNLSSYFTVDKDGNLRPSTAAWDIGAYEYVNTVLSAPTNLRLTN